MKSRQLLVSALSAILMMGLSAVMLTVGLASAQEPDEVTGVQSSAQDPTATQSPAPEDDSGPSEVQDPPATPVLVLTGAGWLEQTSILPAADVSLLALNPVDCAVLSSPVVGYEISKGQDPNDETDFLNDLMTQGYSLGSVDISVGSIPSCVNLLIVQGLAQNSHLSTAYISGEGMLLKNWAASGHGLMLSGDWGSFKTETQALFQAYGYSQQGGVVGDPTDFDPGGPIIAPNIWVIYQMDNFASHPILTGVVSLQLQASSWLVPDTNAIVTTDADASPASVPVMAAFTDGAGCVVLTTDSNWNATNNGAGGYLKQNNAQVARQMVEWLTNCTGLNLTKTAFPNPVQAGQVITYTLTAGNNSAGTLTNVVISDTVPADTSFVAATLPYSGPDAAGVVTWPLGPLGVNASSTITMVVQVDSSVPTGTLITNMAIVTSSQGLTDVATTITTVGNQNVNLAVTKAVQPSAAQPGEVVTFALTVQHINSNSSATNVQVMDQLPNEAKILSAQADIGTTTSIGQMVTWTLPVLNPVDIGTMTIRARIRRNVNPPLIIRNQAVLSFDQGADLPSNIVEVDIRGVARPSPPPAPTRAPREDDDDDDDMDPPPTAVPAIAALATPSAPAELPVIILPDTGNRAAYWPVSGWLWLGLAVVLVVGLSLIRFSMDRKT